MFTLETHLFVVLGPHELLRVTIDMSNAAVANVRAIAILDTVTSNQETLVWCVPSPVVTVFQILKVRRHTGDFLAVNFVYDCH